MGVCFHFPPAEVCMQAEEDGSDQSLGCMLVRAQRSLEGQMSKGRGTEQEEKPSFPDQPGEHLHRERERFLYILIYIYLV